MDLEKNKAARPVTLGDLQQFRRELLRELRKMISAQPVQMRKAYLKSHEVRKLLKISHGTLQHLRDSGKLKYSKVGGIFFYDLADIEAMMALPGN